VQYHATSRTALLPLREAPGGAKALAQRACPERSRRVSAGYTKTNSPSAVGAAEVSQSVRAGYAAAKTTSTVGAAHSWNQYVWKFPIEEH
jgi:hypothetical protein